MMYRVSAQSLNITSALCNFMPLTFTCYNPQQLFTICGFISNRVSHLSHNRRQYMSMWHRQPRDEILIQTGTLASPSSRSVPRRCPERHLSPTLSSATTSQSPLAALVVCSRRTWKEGVMETELSVLSYQADSQSLLCCSHTYTHKEHHALPRFPKLHNSPKKAGFIAQHIQPVYFITFHNFILVYKINVHLFFEQAQPLPLNEIMLQVMLSLFLLPLLRSLIYCAVFLKLFCHCW